MEQIQTFFANEPGPTIAHKYYQGLGLNACSLVLETTSFQLFLMKTFVQGVSPVVPPVQPVSLNGILIWFSPLFEPIRDISPSTLTRLLFY